MPINHVQSVLPDPEYIQALEAELRELRSLLQRALLDIQAFRQGR